MQIKDRVLVIEDETNISGFIATVLEANGYDALTARTGSEAISTITSHCPDVILLDLGLPDMEGSRILRFVREWSTCPVIVVSARNHERDKVEALDASAPPSGTPAPTCLTAASPSPASSGPWAWSLTTTSTRCWWTGRTPA